MKIFNLFTKAQAQEINPTELFAAFGGKNNILAINACSTRLRIKVAQISQINKSELSKLGAKAIFEQGEEVHAVFGDKSAELCLQMQKNWQPEISNNSEQLTFIELLGGKKNIASIEFCAISRIRIELKKKVTQPIKSPLFDAIMPISDLIIHFISINKAQELANDLKLNIF